MGFWRFVLMIFIAGVFGYFSHSYASGFLLLLFMCVINMLLNWVKEGRL